MSRQAVLRSNRRVKLSIGRRRVRAGPHVLHTSVTSPVPEALSASYSRAIKTGKGFVTLSAQKGLEVTGTRWLTGFLFAAVATTLVDSSPTRSLSGTLYAAS